MKKMSLFFSILMLIFTFSACSKKDKVVITVGQSYGGGIVAYVDSTGQHGLIAANSDLDGTSIWGCQGTLIGTSSSYKQGLLNTQKIISGCSEITAARKCGDLIKDGRDDWFLPSFEELVLLYENLHKKGLGNFKASIYASSSESNNDPIHGPSINITRLDFSPGFSSYTPKIGAYNVRACRYF
jgi:hypothetical protein